MAISWQNFAEGFAIGLIVVGVSISAITSASRAKLESDLSNIRASNTSLADTNKQLRSSL